MKTHQHLQITIHISKLPFDFLKISRSTRAQAESTKRRRSESPHTTFVLTLKRSSALCKHLVHQLDPMHQRAQGHTGTGWRLPLTATVNFQHNQFMCSSIITICVLHEEDSPEEQNSAGCSSSPWATPGAKGRSRKWRRRKRGREVKEKGGEDDDGKKRRRAAVLTIHRSKN